MSETIYSKLLRDYKEKNFINNEQLGSLLGIAASSVTRIINGSSTRIQSDTKEKIAHLVGLQPDQISEDILQIKKPILGIVKAGYNLLIDENILGYQTVTPDEDKKGDFFLKVSGDSMELAKIHNNDLLYIQKCDDVPSGTIAIVLIGDEVTVKRVIKKPNVFILEAANPNVENRYFTPEEVNEIPIKIIGKAIYSKTTLL